MTKKVTLVLTLLLAISLVWLVGSFINVLAAANVIVDDAIMLAPPAETMIDSGSVPVPVLVNQQTVTQTVLYLPAIFHNFCSNSFSYNETLRYDLSIIKAAAAWQSCYQGGGVTVAVVDTGIDLDHPDLQANLVTGHTFVSGTSTPDDDEGHGTHVAGIIAAVNNNGGIIGVAPEASLMPVKVLDQAGSGSIYDVADGIEWAVNNGADIINLSLGSVADSATLKAAIDYAYNNGVLIVAAGGNCGDSAYYLNGCSYQDQPVYPGAYTNVMAVASTDSNDNQSTFSNQGSYIEIAAPGSNIYSTYPPSSYATMSGTSMAAPHVAGLAALIWSQNPSWTNQQVRVQIDNSVQDLGPSGWDSQFGYGRIDAAAVLSSLQTTAAPELAPVETETQAPYLAGEILLKVRGGFTVNNVVDQSELRKAAAKVAGTLDQIGVQKLTVAAGQEETLLKQLRTAAGVEYAELNYVVRVADDR